MLNKLLLTGFMGSGKSTTLVEIKRLAPEWRCLDLDDLLAPAGEKVAALIQRVGWDEFRRLEKARLAELLQSDEALVLALGGGTLVQGLPLVQQHSEALLVHLAVPFALCWQRIQQDPSERPLVALGEAKVRALFDERQALYQQAHLTVDGSLAPREVALAILQRAR